MIGTLQDVNHTLLCLKRLKKIIAQPKKTLQQITTTNLTSLWLINGLAPFQSDSHYYNTDQPVLRTKVVSFDFNSSLDSNDDFCSGQSLISTTDLFRTTLTWSIAQHDWQRKATKRKIWQKSILLIELHSWHEMIKLKIWTLFWKRKHLCFVLHEGKKWLVQCHLTSCIHFFVQSTGVGFSVEVLCLKLWCLVKSLFWKPSELKFSVL